MNPTPTRLLTAAMALTLTAGCSSTATESRATVPAPPGAVGVDSRLGHAPATSSSAQKSAAAPPAPTMAGSASGAAAPKAADTTTAGPHHAASPRGGVAEWSAADTPDQVAGKYAAMTWAVDTVTDQGPIAAQYRAAQYATEDLAHQLQSGGPANGGGASWSTLAAHHGWTTAAVEVTSTPDAPDTPTAKFRQVVVSITAHGAAGWTDPHLYPAQVMFVQLSPASSGWRVSASTASPQ